jgi:hypothetical protein
MITNDDYVHLYPYHHLITYLHTHDRFTSVRYRFFISLTFGLRQFNKWPIENIYYSVVSIIDFRRVRITYKQDLDLEIVSHQDD